MKRIKELMNLSGQCAVITGGGGHFGKAFGLTLAELGANVVLVDVNDDLLKSAKNEIKSQWNVEVTTFTCDLESEKERTDLISFIKLHFKINILINNAAFAGTSDLKGWVVPFEQQTVDTWRRALEVNLTAVFHLTKELFNESSEKCKGTIINVSSIYGILGPDMSLYDDTSMGNPAAYAASKGGMIQLTRWLSTVMAPYVRVNCISPGGVERGQPKVFQEKYISRTPLGRMGTEDDMTGIIAYLADRKSVV